MCHINTYTILKLFVVPTWLEYFLVKLPQAKCLFKYVFYIRIAVNYHVNSIYDDILQTSGMFQSTIKLLDL